MSLNEDSLDIIKAMKSYLSKYKLFRDNIAPNLEETAKIDGDIFTSHGYGHCKRIFQQLNNLLGNYQQFLDDIKEEELFCLSLAVLLHDIIMTKNPEFRRTHSIEARDFIRKEFEKLKGSFMAISLGDSVVDAIADIVYAHSDSKDKTGNIVEHTLEIVKDSTEQGESGTIRTYILAALLRLGDELDCTSARINDCQQLVNREEIKNNEHWRKCELIRSIKPPDSTRSDIVLKINDLILRDSDNKANDLELIKDVLQKLKNSLEEVNRLVFLHKSISWWHFTTVRFEKESKKLIEELEKQDPLGSPLQSRDFSEDHQHKEKDATCLICSADREISNKLKEWVLEDNMLHSGHFKISQTRHARDWIDTSRLLENQKYFGEIVNSFVSILKKENLEQKDVVLIGEGFPGLIIASQIGFIGGYGCSYIALNDNTSNANTYTSSPCIPQNKRLVLVTDVVAQAETIKGLLRHIGTTYGTSPEKVAAVLSIFYRKPQNGSISLSGNIESKFFPLNTDFPIELCGTLPNKCVFYKNKLVDVMYESLDQ